MIEVAQWCGKSFGSLVTDYTEQLTLFDEVRRQTLLRKRRAEAVSNSDVLIKPVTDNYYERLHHLAVSKLGPARFWRSQFCVRPGFIDIKLVSGVIAALIQGTAVLKRQTNTNLLVYRAKLNEAQVAFVPIHIRKVTEAFEWLIPDQAWEFLTLPNSGLSLDYVMQEILLITPFGEKRLPWKSLLETR